MEQGGWGHIRGASRAEVRRDVLGAWRGGGQGAEGGAGATEDLAGLVSFGPLAVELGRDGGVEGGGTKRLTHGLACVDVLLDCAVKIIFCELRHVVEMAIGVDSPMGQPDRGES